MSANHPQPHHQPYTALQQDRQARNRPANVHSAATSGSLRGSGGIRQQRSALARDETFEERERRYNAARILESNEMLIWHSVARNEVRSPHFEHTLWRIGDMKDGSIKRQAARLGDYNVFAHALHSLTLSLLSISSNHPLLALSAILQ